MLHLQQKRQESAQSTREVTIIEMGSRLIQREDEDVSVAIQEILAREDIKVRLNAKCIGFSKQSEETIAHLDCASGALCFGDTHYSESCDTTFGVCVAASRRLRALSTDP